MKEIKTPEAFISYCETLEMTEIPDAFAQLNDDLKENSTVQDFVLEKNGLSFEFFETALKNDKEYVLRKLSLSHLAPYMLKYVDDSLVGDDDLLEAASKASPGYHIFLDKEKWGKDKDWYKKIAGFHHHTIYRMPDEIKNSVEMCKAFLDINVWSFKFFSDEMKANKTVQRYALRKNGYVISYFDEKLKCDRNFIVDILEDCWGKDNTAFLIFKICDELKNDQKLKNLAIERDHRIFNTMYPEDIRSKELFKHYLKVTPKIFQYVPENLREDKELFLSLLSGGFDDRVRGELFSKSKFYNDLDFAREVVSDTDYAFTYSYLKPEFKVDEKVIKNAIKNTPEVKKKISAENVTPEIEALIKETEQLIIENKLKAQRSHPYFKLDELKANEAYHLFNICRENLIGKSVMVEIEEASVDIEWFGSLIIEDDSEIDGHFEGVSKEQVELTYQISNDNINNFFKDLKNLMKVNTAFFNNADDIAMEMKSFELFADRFFDEDKNQIDVSDLDNLWSERWEQEDMDTLYEEKGINIESIPIVKNPFKLSPSYDNLDKEIYQIITSLDDYHHLLKTVSELMNFLKSSADIVDYSKVFKSDASEAKIANTIKGLQLIHDERKKIPGNLAYFLFLVADDRIKAKSYHIDIDEVTIPFTYIQCVTPPIGEEVEIERRGYAKEKCYLTYEDRNKFVHDLELMLTPSTTVEHQADHEDFNNISYSYDEKIYEVVDLGGDNVELHEDDLYYIEDDYEDLKNNMIVEGDHELEFSKMVIETAPEVSFKELKL